MSGIKLNKRKIRHIRVRKKFRVLLNTQDYQYLEVINLYMHKLLTMKLTIQLLHVAAKTMMLLKIRLKISQDYPKKVSMLIKLA